MKMFIICLTLKHTEAFVSFSKFSYFFVLLLTVLDPTEFKVTTNLTARGYSYFSFLHEFGYQNIQQTLILCSFGIPKFQNKVKR